MKRETNNFDSEISSSTQQYGGQTLELVRQLNSYKTTLVRNSDGEWGEIGKLLHLFLESAIKHVHNSLTVPKIQIV